MRKIQNLELIIISLCILLPSFNCFERIISKSFLDPSTTQKKDFWDIRDSEENDYEIDDYFKCNNQKYFGPFSNEFSIKNYYHNLNPYHMILGEFELLLLDTQEKQVYSDLLQMYISENQITNFTITEINHDVKCFQMQGNHKLFSVNFGKKIAEKSYLDDDMDFESLTIKILLNGIAKQWAV